MAPTIASDMIVDTFRCFMPIAIMGSLNILIIKKLHASAKVRLARNATESTKESKDNQFTRTLVQLNALFFIFTFPLAFIYVIKDAYFYLVGGNNLTYILINFAWAVSFNFATIHYVVFFIVNFYFNKLFRTEIHIIFLTKGNDTPDSGNSAVLHPTAAIPRTVQP
jgi:hypothetical protein